MVRLPGMNSAAQRHAVWCPECSLLGVLVAQDIANQHLPVMLPSTRLRNIHTNGCATYIDMAAENPKL